MELNVEEIKEVYFEPQITWSDLLIIAIKDTLLHIYFYYNPENKEIEKVGIYHEAYKTKRCPFCKATSNSLCQPLHDDFYNNIELILNYSEIRYLIPELRHKWKKYKETSLKSLE